MYSSTLYLPESQMSENLVVCPKCDEKNEFEYEYTEPYYCFCCQNCNFAGVMDVGEKETDEAMLKKIEEIPVKWCFIEREVPCKNIPDEYDDTLFDRPYSNDLLELFHKCESFEVGSYNYFDKKEHYPEGSGGCFTWLLCRDGEGKLFVENWVSGA